MGIKDITLTTPSSRSENETTDPSIAKAPITLETQPLNSKASTTTLEGVPLPPNLEDIIKSGAQTSITTNPLSGSILKILAENGFKEKIQSGYANGHRYTILHSAPSTEFTLIDTWNETQVDEGGNQVTTPRKKYQIFSIDLPQSPKDVGAQPINSSGSSSMTATPVTEQTSPIVATPEPSTEIPTEASSLSPGKTGLESLSEIQKETEAAAAATEPKRVDDSERAQIIAGKIKKGGAGMTPEDWQFRNENTQLVETYLAPSTPTKETTPKQEPANPDLKQVQEEPSGQPAPTIEQPTTPTTDQNPESSTDSQQANSGTGSNLSPQHYDARAWIMQRLGQQKTVPAVKESPSENSLPDSEPSPKTSSYDLLKKKFGQKAAGVTAAQSEVPQSEVTAESQKVSLSPLEKRKIFIDEIFGTNDALWNMTQTIPARAFIYPSEYAWGTDAKGNPVDRNLEDYPAPALKLREKIANAVESLHATGVDIETTPIGTIIDQLFVNKLL